MVVKDYRLVAKAIDKARVRILNSHTFGLQVPTIVEELCTQFLIEDSNFDVVSFKAMCYATLKGGAN